MPVTVYKKTTPRVAAAPMTTDPKLQIAVSEKGGVSIYGLGRFPVSLYFEQWERLLGCAPEIVDYMTEHADQLASKEVSQAEQTVEERTFTLGSAEIALLSAEEARLIGENAPIADVVKIATIKQMGLNRLKVSFDQLAEVQRLKARR